MLFRAQLAWAFSFRTFIFAFSFETFIRVCSYSSTLSGQPLEYASSTDLIDRWGNVVAWAETPWYDPLGFLQQVVTIGWWLLRELFLKSPVFWVVTISSLLHWAYRDFYKYLAVGQGGGTPATFSGWCQVTVLHFIAHYIFRVDIFGDPSPDPMLEPFRGQLFNLPTRQHVRPTIIGLMHQRQADQRGSPGTEAAINSLLERKAAQNPANLVMEQSVFEPHLRALKRRLPAGAVAGDLGTAAEWGGEIAHAHYEGSAHVVLHPADAAELILAGWGERHPLACCAEHWLWRVYHHKWRKVPLPLPNNLVLVYAPRDGAEMAVFERIVNAAVWFHALHKGGENAKPANAWTPPPVRPFFSPGPTAPAPDSGARRYPPEWYYED